MKENLSKYQNKMYFYANNNRFIRYLHLQKGVVCVYKSRILNTIPQKTIAAHTECQTKCKCRRKRRKSARNREAFLLSWPVRTHPAALRWFHFAVLKAYRCCCGGSRITNLNKI